MKEPQIVSLADTAQHIIDAMSDKLVEDIALIDVSNVSSFADYFIIGTAGNDRQMRAVLDDLDRDLGVPDLRVRRREGAAGSGWVLIDFGEIVVHLFSPEARAFYRLDDLWSRNAPIVRFT